MNHNFTFSVLCLTVRCGTHTFGCLVRQFGYLEIISAGWGWTEGGERGKDTENVVLLILSNRQRKIPQIVFFCNISKKTHWMKHLRHVQINFHYPGIWILSLYALLSADGLVFPVVYPFVYSTQTNVLRGYLMLDWSENFFFFNYNRTDWTFCTVLLWTTTLKLLSILLMTCRWKN